MTFLPASASAAPVYGARPGVRVVVRGGFYEPRYYAPRRVYVGPGFYGPVYVQHYRYWDARFHCWRYYR